MASPGRTAGNAQIQPEPAGVPGLASGCAAAQAPGAGAGVHRASRGCGTWTGTLTRSLRRYNLRPHSPPKPSEKYRYTCSLLSAPYTVCQDIWATICCAIKIKLGISTLRSTTTTRVLQYKSLNLVRLKRRKISTKGLAFLGRLLYASNCSCM